MKVTSILWALVFSLVKLTSIRVHIQRLWGSNNIMNIKYLTHRKCSVNSSYQFWHYLCNTLTKLRSSPLPTKLVCKGSSWPFHILPVSPHFTHSHILYILWKLYQWCSIFIMVLQEIKFTSFRNGGMVRGTKILWSSQGLWRDEAMGQCYWSTVKARALKSLVRAVIREDWSHCQK